MLDERPSCAAKQFDSGVLNFNYTNPSQKIETAAGNVQLVGCGFESHGGTSEVSPFGDTFFIFSGNQPVGTDDGS
jgi:hypothetical protein